jgi:hypothetical protein
LPDEPFPSTYPIVLKSRNIAFSFHLESGIIYFGCCNPFQYNLTVNKKHRKMMLIQPEQGCYLMPRGAFTIPQPYSLFGFALFDDVVLKISLSSIGAIEGFAERSSAATPETKRATEGSSAAAPIVIT